MKRLFLIAAMFCSIQALFAQKLAADKIPHVVKETFKKTYPKATASWEREDGAYEANFKESGKTMSCVINAQGIILETESPLTFSELPAVAKTYVAKHYKGAKPKEVAKIVGANGETKYEVNFGNGDVLFDSNGNHLEKKEKKEKD